VTPVDFVASGGIPIRCHGARVVGNFVGTSFSFRFIKIGLETRLGPCGQDDGFCGLVMGCHTHKRRLKYSNLMLTCERDL
jgi:hypothetical protein